MPRPSSVFAYEWDIGTEALKILIASAPKTGNTWLKAILSTLFDLPIASLDGRFSLAQAESLGPRWVAHQHYRPTPEILTWARKNDVRIVTMVRHPADSLVSYYHYARNYPENFREDLRLNRVIEAARRQEREPGNDRIYDDSLLSALLDRLIADLSISISWSATRSSAIVPYEELLLDPRRTVARLGSRFAVISEEAVDRAVSRSDLEKLRKRAGADARFFRKGDMGEWRDALPARIIRRLCEEEPYRSQIVFLGYKIDEGSPAGGGRTVPKAASHPGSFLNGVALAAIHRLAFERQDRAWPSIETVGEGSFFEWLNAAADDDPSSGAVPLITNLAAFIYRERADVQRVYPDIYESGRVAFADWFLRYTIEEYQLDRAFLTPVALSWIRDL